MLHILLLLLFLQPSPGTPTRSPGAALSRVASTGQSPSTVRPVGPGPPPPRELSSTTGPEEGLGETSSLCGLLLAFRHLRGRGVTQAGVMRPSKQDVGWEGGRESLGPQECGRRCRSVGIQGKSPVMGDWGSVSNGEHCRGARGSQLQPKGVSHLQLYLQHLWSTAAL